MRMKSTIRLISNKLFVLFLCLSILICSTGTLQVSATETPGQIIKIGIFPYEDQMKVDAHGNYSGYGYEYLLELARYTGWRYEFVDASWSDCLTMLKQGELDMLGAVMRSPEREAVYEFTDSPMISGYGVLVTPLENETLPYEDFRSFDGLTVGVLRNNLHGENFLNYSREHGFTPILKAYEAQADMEDALASGEISAMIMTNTLHSQSLRVIASFGENDAYFATAKGNTALIDQLNDAMRLIRLNDPYFNTKLEEKYYNLQTATVISFTREELDFINSCSSIPCVYIPAAPPITFYDEKSETVRGVAVDVSRLLEERTGLTFTWLHPSSASEAVALLRDGDALLLPAKYYDLDWAMQNDVMLTDPYLLGQMVMVTGMPDSENGIIALYDQDSQSRLVANAVSEGAQLRQYATVIDCMNAVLAEEANATFINSTIASFLVNNPKYAQLQTSPLYGFSADVSMAVSGHADPLLLSVLNKGLRNISSTEINQIVLSQMKREPGNPFATYLYLHPVKTVFFLVCIFLTFLLILLALLYLLLKGSRKMRTMLYTDALTGSPNYRALAAEAKTLIGQKPQEYAVIYLDIHQFKTINDTYGYEVGDSVLRATSDALRNFVAPNERVARIYADTFVLLLNYAFPAILRDRLDSLSGLLGKLTFEGKSSIKPLFCGGVYLLPEEYNNLDKACDRANYAKDTITQYFSNTFVFYDDIMRNRVLAEKELENSMLSALLQEEFIPYYQPKVNTITGKVIGVEALVRWRHPEKGLIPPSEFLPFYEKNGFIVKIDLTIFEQVCRDMHAWLSKGNQTVPVSVNFSRQHMRDRNLPGRLKEIADRYEVPSCFLEVEVTETEELENVETAVDFVQSLKEYGFGISIDDYGTGYSSISFLQQLPLDALKLDRNFILNAMKSDKAKDIMRYLVTAMQKNGIRVVCEGIETKEQRDFIVALNCRFIQGFLYSVPLPREEFEAYLFSHGSDTSDNLDFIPITNFEEKHWDNAEEFLSKAMPSWIVACLVAPDFPIQYISPNFLDGMGYSKLEFWSATNGHYTKCLHPDDLPRILERLELNRNSVQDFSLQYRLRKKDGSYLWIKEIAKRIIMEDGREVLLSVCTSISNIVELQLEKSRIIDTIPGGVGELLLTDEGPVIHQASDRFYDIIGYTKEDMEELGNNIHRIICEQDKAAAASTLGEALESAKTFCECSFRVRHKNGSLHWISFRGTISDCAAKRQATVIIYNYDKEMQARQSADIARKKLELALLSTEHIVFEYDITTRAILSHSGFSQFGIPDTEEIQHPSQVSFDEYVHPDDRNKIRNAHDRIAAGEERVSYEIRMRSKLPQPDSPYLWLRVTLITIFNEDKVATQAVGIIENINRQKRFELDLLQEAQFRKAFTQSSLMAYEMNLTKDTLQRSAGSRAFRLEELRNSLTDPGCYSLVLPAAAEVLVSADDRALFRSEMSRENLLKLYRDGILEKELEYRRLTLDGTELWNSVLVYLLPDQLTGDIMAYAYHRDIHQRKEAERDLMELAARDPLTGILNRATAEQLIESYLLRSQEAEHLHAFLMLDMDHFKEINDTYGHLTGDRCLIRLAQMITAHAGDGDTVARMGGDEFALFLKEIPDESHAVAIAEELIRDVAQIGTELGTELQTSVSIGLSFFPYQGTDFEQLYRQADEAMYAAKETADIHIVLAGREKG